MHDTATGCPIVWRRPVWLWLALLVATIAGEFLTVAKRRSGDGNNLASTRGLIMLASGHVVLTRDDAGQSLVLTGEDGKGGKGKGGSDQLVIAGNNMGGSRNSNIVLEDASNREGDVVMSGKNLIIPGEDGHIVLADGRSGERQGGGNAAPAPFMPNFFALWMPYMYGRGYYRIAPMFYGGQFG